MKKLTAQFGIVSLSLALLGASPAFAQSKNTELDTLKQQIEALQKGQTTLQKELAEIKKLLQARQPRGARPFQPTDVSVGDAPSLGDADAPVTLVEFTDDQCPFCRRHYTNVMPALLKNYVNTGKLKYVLRDYPIPQLHPDAMKAAEAAHCAGDQGQYWKMHDLIFLNQRQIAPDDLKAKAKSLGLDPESFMDCLNSGKYAQRVREDMAEGSSAVYNNPIAQPLVDWYSNLDSW
jgi:protein-disulfide isomerase